MAGFLYWRASWLWQTVDDKVGIHHLLAGVNTIRNVGGKLRPGGILGGLQLGYNWQSGSLVYGVEADATLLSGRASFTGVYPAPIATTVTTTASKDWAGSLRARMGFSVGQALIYGTAGVSLTDVKYSVSPVGGVPGSTSNVRFGPVIGAGIEYAINNNWSARVEGLYTFLGKDRYYLATLAGAQLGTFETQSHWQIRLGLNYRFGGPAGPVIAKY